MGRNRMEQGLPFYLLVGFAISAVGGPLALAVLNVPQYSGPGYSPFIVVLVASLLFASAIAVWYRYSKVVASSGGLYEFVRRAAGPRVAKAQGLAWSLSYFLYLPYTVTYISFYMLPGMFGMAPAYSYALELIIPAAIIAVMLAGRRMPFFLLLALACTQVALVVVLGLVAFAHAGLGASAILPYGTAPATVLQNAMPASLLFVCAGLPLFLGGEAAGGRRAIRKALATAFAVTVAILLLYAALANGAAGIYHDYVYPGYHIALASGGQGFAVVVGLLAVLSIVGLIIAEFVALGRLAHHALGIGVPRANLYVAIAFIAFDAMSLVDPTAFYGYALFISLLALYASQLIVFVVYPIFARKHFGLSSIDIVLASVASIIMAYGLYTVLLQAVPYG